MSLRYGERVFWGTPEVIYLEGSVISADGQSAVVLVDRATPYSAHLIGSKVVFALDGIQRLEGKSPPGTTSVRSVTRTSPPEMDDDEKIRRAALALIHQRYGYELPKDQEQALTQEVAQAIQSDVAMRTQIIHSMDEILRREF